MDCVQREFLVERAVAAFAEDTEYVVNAVTLDDSSPPLSQGPLVWGAPPRFVRESPLDR